MQYIRERVSEFTTDIDCQNSPPVGVRVQIITITICGYSSCVKFGYSLAPITIDINVGQKHDLEFNADSNQC